MIQSGYDWVINYGEDSVPPLAAQDREWLSIPLKQAGLNIP